MEIFSQLETWSGILNGQSTSESRDKRGLLRWDLRVHLSSISSPRLLRRTSRVSLWSCSASTLQRQELKRRRDFSLKPKLEKEETRLYTLAQNQFISNLVSTTSLLWSKKAKQSLLQLPVMFNQLKWCLSCQFYASKRLSLFALSRVSTILESLLISKLLSVLQFAMLERRTYDIEDKRERDGI